MFNILGNVFLRQWSLELFLDLFLKTKASDVKRKTFWEFIE